MTFTAADSGANGYTVFWQGASGSRPVISGGQKVTGWTVADSGQNIWRANVGTGFDTRQFYVDGRVATRARTQVNRGDFTATTSGLSFTNSALSYLNNVADESRVEVESVDSFTDRYVPVQTIANNMITMKQPAWNNNTWGYDTLSKPFRAGPLYLANAREFLDAAGEWYLDTAAGVLYYKPLVRAEHGHRRRRSCRRLESLLRIGGTYATPAHHLSFVGLQFAVHQLATAQQHPGLRRPADRRVHLRHLEQAVRLAHLLPVRLPGFSRRPARAGGRCRRRSRCRRPTPSPSPTTGSPTSARSASASATTPTRTPPASASAPATSTSSATSSSTSRPGRSSSAASQADAHHPSDSRMTNRNITVSDNLIHDVALEYRSHVGMLMTYTTASSIGAQ